MLTEEGIKVLIDNRIRQERMGRALRDIQVAVEMGLSNGLEFRDLERVIPIAIKRATNKDVFFHIRQARRDSQILDAPSQVLDAPSQVLDRNQQVLDADT